MTERTIKADMSQRPDCQCDGDCERWGGCFEVDEERELLGLWLARVMFNQFVGWPPEIRTFEEWLNAYRARRSE